MDHPSLVALFRRIVLAGPPLVLSVGFDAGCTQYDPCPNLHDETMTFAVAEGDAGALDAGIDDLVMRCQAHAADCTPVCEYFVPAYKGQIKACTPTSSDGGLAVRVVYRPICIGGRRPEGLAAPASRRARDPLAAWLAANAHLEAASIPAFQILARELGAHSSPRTLIEAARAAIADERRHARAMGRLATRRGARPPRAQVERRPVRDLEAIARENAIEGCVRETYAALLACRQARAATDPAIRAAMAGIAHDETRHAALAWAVDEWSRSSLTPAARRRVREARHEALAQLLDGARADLPGDSRARAGLPDEEEEARMAGALGAALV